MWEFVRVVVCSTEIFGGCELFGPSGAIDFGLFLTEQECEEKIEIHMRNAVLDVYGMDDATYKVICKRPKGLT